ncbi:hypothetical protein CBR_g10955 [Chara braunii]|uniref:Uncharacterized protein n=1 Tax=Chara braunii TaxID=69332 RepID=A0A388KPP2_CHABU|nr:hypothetical protein CBR_g10955 [Chara braunii]|eukprot:GBG72019.1 hypothetical protein CBR_g10955 [Chara braunii]
MAGMQIRAVLPAAEGERRPPTTEPSRRYDPSMYSHLPSWETPLPPSDEEPEGDELPTFPLASGSTQLLSQTVLAGGSASNGCGEYTTLLQQGLGDDDDGGVDLRFGLSSRGGREASRTFIIDADPSPRGVQPVSYTHLDVYKRQVWRTSHEECRTCGHTAMVATTMVVAVTMQTGDSGKTWRQGTTTTTFLFGLWGRRAGGGEDAAGVLFMVDPLAVGAEVASAMTTGSLRRTGPRKSKSKAHRQQ